MFDKYQDIRRLYMNHGHTRKPSVNPAPGLEWNMLIHGFLCMSN